MFPPEYYSLKLYVVQLPKAIQYIIKSQNETTQLLQNTSHTQQTCSNPHPYLYKLKHPIIHLRFHLQRHHLAILTSSPRNHVSLIHIRLYIYFSSRESAVRGYHHEVYTYYSSSSSSSGVEANEDRRPGEREYGWMMMMTSGMHRWIDDGNARGNRGNRACSAGKYLD